jgi:hypothetical protein
MDVEARIPSAIELKRQFDEAFRSCGGIAEPHEVGEFVQRIVGPRLQERRHRIGEVRKLRSRMEEIARPSSPYGDISPDEMVKTGDEDDSGQRTKQEGIQRLRQQAQSAATSLEVPRVTESVSLGARIVPPLRWKPVAVGAGATVALITALAVWRSASAPDAVESTETPPTAEPRAVAASLPAPTASAAAPAPQPSEETAEKPAPESGPAPATEPGRTPPGSRTRAGSRRAQTPPPAEEAAPGKRAEPRSKAPTKLARDPYEDGQ